MQATGKRIMQITSGIALFLFIILVISTIKTTTLTNSLVPSYKTSLNNQSINSDLSSSKIPQSSQPNHNTFNVWFVDNLPNPMTSNWTEADQNGPWKNTFTVASGDYYWQAATNSPGYYSDLEWNINLASYNITNAQFNVTWAMSTKAAPTVSIAEWEYNVNNTGWNVLTSTVQNGAFSLRTSTFNLSQCNLLGTETSVYLRLYVVLDGGAITQSQLHFYSFALGVFQSTITDPGNSGSLLTNYAVQAQINRFGSDSGLIQNINDYRLFYAINYANVNSSSAYIIDPNPTWVAPNQGNFNFQINDGNYTTNSTIYYRLYIYDEQSIITNFYFSPIFSFLVYDGIAPTVNTGTFLYNGSSNPLTCSYNNDLNLSVNISDVAGYLDHVVFYYNFGSSVSEGLHIGSPQTEIIPPETTATQVSFIIPSSVLTAYSNATNETYVLFECYDISLNLGQYSMPIVVNDSVPPTVNITGPGSGINSNDYYQTIAINFTAHEDFRGSGLNASTPYTIYWRETTNSSDIPTSNSSCTGYMAWTMVYNPFNDNQYNVQLIGLTPIYNETVFVWMQAMDGRGNIGYSTYRTIYINDTEPLWITNLSPLSAIGYNENLNFSFQVIKPGNSIGRSSGLNYSATFVYYKINSTIIGYNSSATNITPLLTRTVNAYSAIIPCTWIYHDQIDIFISVADNVQNTNNSVYYSFAIVDPYPPITMLDPTYPDSNYTIARTYYDLQIAVNASDVLGGSGFANITMEYQYDNAFNWNYSVTPISPLSSSVAPIYKFLIPSANLTTLNTPYRTIYYMMRALDRDGNVGYYNNSVTIINQNTHPNVFSTDVGDRSAHYYNSLSINMTFTVDSNCLMWVYLNGTTDQAQPFVGTTFTDLLNFSHEGQYNLTVIYFNDSWYWPIYIITTPPPAINASSFMASFSGSSISLNWAAPAQNFPGNQYEYLIYRGSTANFNLTDGTKIDEVSTLSYDDFITTPGTYYYEIVVEDLAGNLSPVSTSVEVVIPIPSYIYIIIAVAVAGAVVAVIYLRKRAKENSKTLAERNVKRSLAKETTPKNKAKDEFWDKEDEKAVKPKKEDDGLAWKDLSTDGWTQRIAASTSSTPTSKITSNSASFQTSTNDSSAQETSTSAQPSVNNAPKTGDLTSRFDAEMRDLYTNAEEFLQAGQDSMAVQSYQMLMRLAEKKNDPELIAFIQKKIDSL